MLAIGLLIVSCTKPTFEPNTDSNEVPTWNEKGGNGSEEQVVVGEGSKPTHGGDVKPADDGGFKPTDEGDITDPNNDPDGIAKKAVN